MMHKSFFGNNYRQTITASQALLLLLGSFDNDPELRKQIGEILETNPDEKNTHAALKKLFLLGVRSDEDITKINILCKMKALQPYNVSTHRDNIQKDASRRYFESYLAFETLKQHLDSLDITRLKQHFVSAFDLIDDIVKRVQCEHLYKYGASLRGRLNEYGLLIQKLTPRENNSSNMNNPIEDAVFSQFTDEQKAKLKLLVTIGHTSNVAEELNLNPDPKNTITKLYSTGYFQSKNRGRLDKLNHNNQVELALPSHNYGILRSHMPLPPYEDILLAKNPIPCTRPADRFNFDSTAAWPKKSNATRVSPLVASISGSLLAVLSIFQRLKTTDKFYYADEDKFINFIRCFSSALVLLAGAHTYFELLNVLFLPQVQQEFQTILNSSAQKPPIDETDFLMQNNEPAFEKALQKTITYNNKLLSQAQIQDELKSYAQAKNTLIQDLRSASIMIGSATPAFSNGLSTLIRKTQESVHFDRDKIVDDLSQLLKELESNKSDENTLSKIYEVRLQFGIARTPQPFNRKI